MATTIYSSNFLFSTWEFPSGGGSEYQAPSIYRYPYPKLGAVKKAYLNKVWYAAGNRWVMWETNYPDPGGGFYPGPGEFGIDTSDYRQEVIVHGREQL